MSSPPTSHTLAQEISFNAPVVQAISSTLHAMAQPLTILQSYVLLAAMPDLLKSASPDFLQDLAGEVQRLSATYSGLRDLLSLGQCTSVPGAVHVSEALDHLWQDLEPATRKSEVRLSITHKHPLASLLVNRARLLHALHAIVRIAAEMSPPQSSINLATEIQPRQETPICNLILTISTEADVTHLNFAHHLSFVVAEALLQSDGAAMSFTRKPLIATLVLPSQHI